ncbi:MAG: hypothetical protein ABNH19_12880 [Dokdonia sp.]|jgi:hypothetical protein
MFDFTSIRTRYFWIAVIFVGSAGVWLPVVLSAALGKTIVITEIPMNLTTFYISIYFAGCVDGIFKTIDVIENKYDVKSKLFNLVILILFSLILVVSTVWLTVKDEFWIPLILSLVGAFIGLKLWWENNSENPTFAEEVREEARETHGKKW